MLLEIRLDSGLPCQNCQYWDSGYCQAAKIETFSNESCFLHTKRTDAQPIKRVLEHNGLKIGVTHDAGDYRFKKPMFAGYGHIRKSYGQAEDGLALDVYLGRNLQNPDIWKVRQLNPDTGMLDEHKYFIGFDNPNQVKDTFCHHAGDKRFGGVEKCSIEELNAYREDKAAMQGVKLDYCGCPDLDVQLQVGVERIPELLQPEVSQLKLHPWKGFPVIKACLDWVFPIKVQEIIAVDIGSASITGLFYAENKKTYKYATKGDRLIAWKIQQGIEYEPEEPIVSIELIEPEPNWSDITQNEPNIPLSEITWRDIKEDAIEPPDKDELDWLAEDLKTRIGTIVLHWVKKIQGATESKSSDTDEAKFKNLQETLDKINFDANGLASVIYQHRTLADLFGRSIDVEEDDV